MVRAPEKFNAFNTFDVPLSRLVEPGAGCRVPLGRGVAWWRLGVRASAARTIGGVRTKAGTEGRSGLLRIVLSKQLRDAGLEAWELVLHDVPDDLVIFRVVAVDHPVA
jgi:hypothetical protein